MLADPRAVAIYPALAGMDVPAGAVREANGGWLIDWTAIADYQSGFVAPTGADPTAGAKERATQAAGVVWTADGGLRFADGHTSTGPRDTPWYRYYEELYKLNPSDPGAAQWHAELYSSLNAIDAEWDSYLAQMRAALSNSSGDTRTQLAADIAEMERRRAAGEQLAPGSTYSFTGNGTGSTAPRNPTFQETLAPCSSCSMTGPGFAPPSTGWNDTPLPVSVQSDPNKDPILLTVAAPSVGAGQRDLVATGTAAAMVPGEDVTVGVSWKVILILVLAALAFWYLR
jgi:hypothetical protein